MAYVNLEKAKLMAAGMSEFEAIHEVAQDLILFFLAGFKDKLKEEYLELGCYNLESKQEKICKIFGHISSTPIAALKLLKKSVDLKHLFLNPTLIFSKSSLKGPSGHKYREQNGLGIEYKNEDIGRSFELREMKVPYLDEVERKKYEVFVNERGQIVDINGKPVDTKRSKTSRSKGKAIFVMDENGRIYISHEQISGKNHHSTYIAGDEAAAAGEIKIENEYLLLADRTSGHYFLSEDMHKQFYYELQQRGADLSRNTITYDYVK